MTFLVQSTETDDEEEVNSIPPIMPIVIEGTVYDVC